jgi:hypothetical protein
VTLIGFTGLAGSGKSTAANYLVRKHGFVRVRFADTLKEMMRVFGLGQAEIEGGLKERPCPLLMGKTPRWAMQSLGTEWGRDCIHPDIWVSAWERKACDVLDHGGRVVVDDVRFDNEVAKLAGMRGALVRVVRPGSVVGSHISENGDFSVDHEIQNAGNIADLFRAVDREIDLALAAS